MHGAWSLEGAVGTGRGEAASRGAWEPCITQVGEYSRLCTSNYGIVGWKPVNRCCEHTGLNLNVCVHGGVQVGDQELPSRALEM